MGTVEKSDVEMMDVEKDKIKLAAEVVKPVASERKTDDLSLKSPEAKKKKLSKEVLGALVKKYFFQLTKGCGKECETEDCGGNPNFQKLEPNAAGKRAILMASKFAAKKLCIHHGKNI